MTNTLKHLGGLLDQWVTVKHPDAPHRVWQGRLTEVWDQWSIVLETPGGGRETFPAAFDVSPASEPAPGPAGAPRPWTDLRASGLLWLINRTTFHPRGVALAVHTDDRGAFTGWSLITNDQGEPWQFDPATDSDGYERAEATLAAARARLLDCGLCYEENGEEVHPHPECPKSAGPAVVDARAHLLMRELDEGSSYPAGALCCVCGGGPVGYDNYKGQLFCWRCADCDCGRDGPCIRTGLHRPQVWACTSLCLEPFHGRARCERHHDRHPDGTPGLWHEGTSQDGSTLFWKDGAPGTTPDTSPDTDSPDNPGTAPETCDEHPGPCFRESGATCSAHGDERCADCHRNPGDCLNSEGQCSTWSRTGMHWDTCTNRDFSPIAAPSPDTSPETDTDSPDNPRTTPDTDTTTRALTSTDTVRTACPDTVREDDPDTARTTCPDTGPDTVRTVWTTRVPRRQMGAALAEAFATITRATPRSPDEDTAAADRAAAEREQNTIREAAARLTPDTAAAAPDEPRPPAAEDTYLGPDGLTDRERERKTIRAALDAELSRPGDVARWKLTVAVSDALRTMPRYSTEIHTLRDRVGELAAALADAIGRFTIPALMDGAAHLRTGYTPAALVEQWRTVHTGRSHPARTFPAVAGICPTCRRDGLYLGSGGCITCPHADCPRPDAATTVLDDPPSAAHTCNRPDCLDLLTKAVEAHRRAAFAYEWLRTDVITAVSFIKQQKRIGPLSPLRCTRSGLLATLPTWIKDPGPLTAAAAS